MSRRKLLLVNPIQRLGGRRQHGWNDHRFVPPLGLAYVAALTPPDWEIRIVDENAGGDAAHLPAFTPDLVGISSYTATIPRAYELAAHFRARGIPVVIGGSHASALPGEVTRHADVAFAGQAEGAWHKVLADLEGGRLRSQYDGGTPPLDGLPWPRRDLYPQRYFFEAVVTSKGCPYRCEFCSIWRTYEKSYHLRPIEEVLDELEQLTARHIFFVDDNLTVDSRRTIALCRGMVERRLNKRFAVQTSLDVGLNEELLRWLRRAGCFLVFVGVESVDEHTLAHQRKASNLKVGVQNFSRAIARIHAHGMAVSAGIIFGNDQDTAETFVELERWVAASKVDSPVYTILTPLPGTDLWARLAAEGRLLAYDLPEGYAYFDAHHVTFRPQNVRADELLAANRGAVRRATSGLRLASGFLATWRRTGSGLAALAALQNNWWARVNALSSPRRSQFPDFGSLASDKTSEVFSDSLLG